jgi:hypothetical protein
MLIRAAEPRRAGSRLLQVYEVWSRRDVRVTVKERGQQRQLCSFFTLAYRWISPQHFDSSWLPF